MKENLLKNSSIGILKIISASIIMLILTSLLVNSLGKTTYGIIALFTSLNQYIGLFILAISGTIFKFVSIEYNKDNNLIETNKYYSTSFFSLIFIISLLFLTTIMLSPYIGDILNIDSYNEIKKDFFILSILSFLLQSVVSVFIVSSMIKHKFYLNDFANIFSKIIQFIFILVLLYLIDDLNLITYGYSLVLFSILYLFLSFLISKRTIPELEITFKFFSFNHLKDILSMGLKVILNNLGILLYTSTDILIISIFLGTAYVTDYSLSLQLALFIALIGSVVSRLFDPEISSQIAKRKFKFLSSYIVMNSKIYFMFVGLFFILITSLSKEVLLLWLGEDFIDIYKYVILLAIYQLLHQSTVLFFKYFTLVNKLTIPLITTLVGGILNVILSVIIVKFTDLGITGIIIVTILTVFLKTVIFNSYYTCHLLGIDFSKLMIMYFKLFIFIVTFALIGYITVEFFCNSSYFLTILYIMTMTICYTVLSYILLFNKKEKISFLHMTKLYKGFKNYA